MSKLPRGVQLPADTAAKERAKPWQSAQQPLQQGAGRASLHRWIERLRSLLAQHPFLARVVLIASGTGAGQAAMLLALPVLSRLYTPADFGVWAVFTALVTLLDPLMAGRFELAIPLAEDDRQALGVLALSGLTLLAMCLAVAGVLGVLPEPWLARQLNLQGTLELRWTLPLALLGTAGTRVLNFWAIRVQALPSMASSRFVQGVGTAALQLLLAWTPLRGPLGLMLGDVLGRLASLMVLLRPLRGHALAAAFRFDALWMLAHRYRQFPLVSSGSVLCNTLGTQLPLLMMNRYLGVQVMGYLALANRLVGTPSALVGQSVAQVYYGEASRLVVERRPGMAALYHATTRRLLLMGLAPTLLFTVAGPWLCGRLLGAQWTEGGQYLRLLGVMFLVQLAVTPVSQSLYILQRQWMQLAWDGMRLLLVPGAVWAAIRLGGGAWGCVATYAFSMLLAYALHFVLTSWVVRQHELQLAGARAAQASDPEVPQEPAQQRAAGDASPQG